jgi:hypothetical protein
MLSAIKTHWNKLVVFATCVVALLGRFLIVPPYGLDERAWYKYGIFLVAVLTGLWLVPMNAWSQKKYRWSWWLAAGILAICSTVVFLHYNTLLEEWTVPYFRESKVIVGRQLTPDATAYTQLLMKQGEPIDDLRLLQKYAGDTAAVWQTSEIFRRERVITTWYLAALLLLASSVITVTQAIYTLSARTT